LIQSGTAQQAFAGFWNWQLAEGLVNPKEIAKKTTVTDVG
jgi:hypothetical protein